MTVFSWVYVKALDDQTTFTPAADSWSYAVVLNLLVVDEPSRIAWTSRPACFRANRADSIRESSISYIVM
jgi:hypothetical protein